MIKKLIFVGFCLLSFVGAGDTLWWGVFDNVTEPIYEQQQKLDDQGNPILNKDGEPVMVSVEVGRNHIGSANVDGVGIYDFVSSYGVDTDETGYNFYNVGARVKMINPDGSSAIVSIAYPDFPGDRFEYAEFFDGGGQNHPSSTFGTGWWSTQSPLHEVPGYNSEMLEEAAFMVELGLLTYDDVLNVVDWETIATSDTAFASQLRGMIFPGGVNEPADFQWTPFNFHATPEPNSLLLMLFGAGILLLRRKLS